MPPEEHTCTSAFLPRILAAPVNFVSGTTLWLPQDRVFIPAIEVPRPRAHADEQRVPAPTQYVPALHASAGRAVRAPMLGRALDSGGAYFTQLGTDALPPPPPQTRPW